MVWSSNLLTLEKLPLKLRDRSRAATTYKMERFVIIVNGFQPINIITTCPILDVAAVLDLLLKLTCVIAFQI